MASGLKIFNWVEDAAKDYGDGGVRSYYEVEQVDDYIRNLNAENIRLQKQYLQAVKVANENIAKNVDGNAKYWKDMCEKRTKMYLEERAAHIAVADELQKQIHKPFQYIEKLEVMKIAFLREMATRAFYESKYIWNKCDGCSPPEVKSNIFKAKKRERQYHLFMKKAAKLEKEFEND